MKIDFNEYKQNINLAEFAASYGYQIDRKKSTKASLAMKTGNNKIIITRKRGIWIYFSVFDERDRGTIIDFVRNRTSQTLPEIARTLAQWAGTATSLPVRGFAVEDQRFDQDRVKAIFDKCRPVTRHQYLESRGLNSELLGSPRFKNQIFIDRYQNAVFPHNYKHEVCGLEIKNASRGLMVKGSRKTFWRSNSFTNDKILVITEAVIDALSYQQIHDHKDYLYFATSGGVSSGQLHMLNDFLKNTGSIKCVILAMDNDKGGQRIADRIAESLRINGFPTEEVIGHPPFREGRDWNDELSNFPT